MIFEQQFDTHKFGNFLHS